MSSRAVDFIITVVLAAYGVYVVSFMPALLVVPAPILLILGRAIEAGLAFVGAYEVWTHRAGAGPTVLALGVVIAIMWLVEAFVYGIVAYLPAIGAAVFAAVAALVAASYVQRHRRTV